MAVAYGSAAVTQANSTNTISATKPSGVTSGDLLVAVCAGNTGTSGTWNTPSGWTSVTSNGSSVNPCAIFKRTADGTEGATITFTTTATQSNFKVTLIRLTGLNPIIDAQAIGTPDTTAATTSDTAPSVSATAGALIIRAYVSCNTLTRTWTPPASHTEQVDSNGAEVVTANSTAAGGATGTAAATLSAVVSMHVGFTITFIEGVTAVSATWALNYELDQQVNTTRALPYAVSSSVNTTRALAWGIPGPVNATRALKYDVLASVNTTRRLPWTVNGSVNTTRAIPWRQNAQVSPTRALPWAVNGSVNTTRVLPWQQRQSVTTARIVPWLMTGSVPQAIRLLWDTSAGVTFSLTQDAIDDLTQLSVGYGVPLKTFYMGVAGGLVSFTTMDDSLISALRDLLTTSTQVLKEGL